MRSLQRIGSLRLLSIFTASMLAATALAGMAAAQTIPPQASQPPSSQIIGHIDATATVERIQVAGAVTLSGGNTLLGNGSTVTAGQTTLPIHLTRGGELDLCATTGVHLSQENTASDANSPLMIALDHGAIEAHYNVGKNSDVVLTPDLRILLSGPGKANVSIRVNTQGDTCIENQGKDAPYLTVSEQIGSGVYRVQPDQRVMFEHGSVRDVVDHETQPCGCPVATPVVSVASAAGTSGEQPAKPGQAVATTPQPIGGPSSTPADTAFPLAESEGLTPPPALPTKPVVQPGEIHSEVTTTLSYAAPKQAIPTGAPNGVATPESAATAAMLPAPGFGPTGNSTPATTAQAPPAPRKKSVHSNSGFFHKIGHFFAHIFG